MRVRAGKTLALVQLILAGTAGAALATEASPPPATTRTLDAIKIEGVADVPQVLFITSRDNVRFDDGLAQLFLTEAQAAVARETTTPLIRPIVFPMIFTAADTSVAAHPALPEAKE